jgi:hypothetical protein
VAIVAGISTVSGVCPCGMGQEHLPKVEVGWHHGKAWWVQKEPCQGVYHTNGDSASRGVDEFTLWRPYREMTEEG